MRSLEIRMLVYAAAGLAWAGIARFYDLPLWAGITGAVIVWVALRITVPVNRGDQ